ncbi:amidase [Aneurinibacillus terranovensis]|uniref:amidase n=1 Tax=Aneurinibacillus terranovensis TaxID=278991 RepID=UPI00041F62F9|nr:amidase [Aneurinibacillus terranovensis]
MANNYNMEVINWDLATLSDAIMDKVISPVEVTRQLLERIELVDKKLNSYITLLHDEALEAARQAEKEIIKGNIRGPLHGIPIGLKDLIYTKGVRTTMGSEIFQNYIPDYDAAVVEKLIEAGAVIVGKLNTHQFAYGPTGDRSFFGPVRNPHDPTRITGGSSSGSGAAVAASLCYAALGTDTGGSIRIPSSCCGIVGMKPTFGRVSKYGVFPLGWTLDHVGPMTRTIRDNAIMLSVLSGHDERDPYSSSKDSEDFSRYLQHGIKGSIIGIPKSFYFDNLDEEVNTKVRQALETFRRLGARIRIVDIPNIEQVSWAHQITMKSEAYSIHEERLHTFPDQWDEEVKERLLSGKAIKASEYVNAQQIRYSSIQEFNKIFKEVEVIITPTIPILPTRISQREVNINGDLEPVRSTINRLTGPTNLIGIPSLSVPCGFSDSGLPIGLQLFGKPYDEANLYRFGYAFEREVQLTPVQPDLIGKI